MLLDVTNNIRCLKLAFLMCRFVSRISEKLLHYMTPWCRKRIFLSLKICFRSKMSIYKEHRTHRTTNNEQISKPMIWCNTSSVLPDFVWQCILTLLSIFSSNVQWEAAICNLKWFKNSENPMFFSFLIFFRGKLMSSNKFEESFLYGYENKLM